jgi:hypothetical protein
MNFDAGRFQGAAEAIQIWTAARVTTLRASGAMRASIRDVHTGFRDIFGSASSLATSLR